MSCTPIPLLLSRLDPNTVSIHKLIVNASANRASDIHIEPVGDEFQLIYRVDGILHKIIKLEKFLGLSLINAIKASVDRG